MIKAPELHRAYDTLKKYCDAYQQRDLNAILALFCQQATLWGTGIDEYRTGLKELAAQHERDWSQSEKGQIKIASLSYSKENPNWIAAVCNAWVTIDGVEHVFEHLRGTIIVENEAGEWKISHMHASFPDYRNPEQGSFPINA